MHYHNDHIHNFLWCALQLLKLIKKIETCLQDLIDWIETCHHSIPKTSQPISSKKRLDTSQKIFFLPLGWGPELNGKCC